MLLTGRKAPVMDYTMAESTGAFDAINLTWEFDYIEALGIDKGLFPQTVSPSTVIGFLNDPSIKGLQSNKKVPVAVAIGDNQASYLGSVKEHFDSLLVNIGTGSQISFTVKDPGDSDLQSLIDGYDVVLRPFVSDNWLVAGNAISGGVVYRALYDFFRKTGEELFGITGFEGLWEKMGEIAIKAKDCRGMEVYPLFEGKRSDPGARGSINGISMENLTPGCLIMGTLRGMVRILMDMIRPEIIEKRKYLIGSGNGVRKNPVLRVVTSELFKRQILVPAHEEEAAVGAAINGGVASGVFKDFDEAKGVIRYF
jgi:sugar (pentulose or hexulose) kinase